MGGLFSEYQIPDTLAGMLWGSLEGMNWAFQPFDLLVFLEGPAVLRGDVLVVLLLSAG